MMTTRDSSRSHNTIPPFFPRGHHPAITPLWCQSSHLLIEGFGLISVQRFFVSIIHLVMYRISSIVQADSDLELPGMVHRRVGFEGTLEFNPRSSCQSLIPSLGLFQSRWSACNSQTWLSGHPSGPKGRTVRPGRLAGRAASQLRG
jgi:hypothetical protein